jgi:hypothetical protein
VTCPTHPCRPCAGTHILHYLPQGGESSPRGSWGIYAPALPEVLTGMFTLSGTCAACLSLHGAAEDKKLMVQPESRIAVLSVGAFVVVGVQSKDNAK